MMNISRYTKIFGVGPLGGILALLILGLLLWLERAIGSAKILNHPTPLTVLGLALIGTWICWHLWAFRTIWRWWTGNQLCTTGPFHYVRHPMYAGFVFLLSPGLVLLLNSRVVVAWPVLMFLILSALVRKEEKMMLDIFGEAYQSYAARTGRLFPKLWS
jgi:protein-S-isoprenylcysteine O-methyltransferase Ste14